MLSEMNQHHDTLARQDKNRRLAEAVRAACIETALRGYEEAKISGLCHEGAWECAIGAIRGLDLEALLKDRSSTSTLPQ